ncbi:MAG: hypothetical protein RLZZ26_471 [Candidatus Parcubacteria bacterium]|jgi:hypothetical protein
MEHWLNFSVVVGVQLLFFLFVAYQKSAWRAITPKLVVQGVCVGTLFGVFFDVLVGKYLGVFSYALGFSLSFLIVNGALSYGLTVITIALLKPESFLRFYVWAVALGVVYEIANHLHPVWFWMFSSDVVYREAVVVFAAYPGLALLIAAASFWIQKPTYTGYGILVK